MRTTVNQLILELQDLAVKHGQINTFFFGDFLSAIELQEVQYPLLTADYQDGQINGSITPLQLIFTISDKTYKDRSNLDETTSDTLQIARDIYNVISRSQRWKQIGRVDSFNFTKFRERGADEVAGHVLTIQFSLLDSQSLCDIPLFGYDMDGNFNSDSCLPVTVKNQVCETEGVQAVWSGQIIDESANYSQTTIRLLENVSNSEIFDFSISFSSIPLADIDTIGNTIQQYFDGQGLFYFNYLGGGNFTFTAVDGGVNYNNTYFDLRYSIDDERVSTITAPITTLGQSGCANLYQVSVASGTTLIIPQTQVTVRNSIGNALIFESVNSVFFNIGFGQNELLFPDTVVNNDATTPTYVYNVPSGEVFTIPKVILTVKNTANTVLNTLNINSAVPYEYIAPDAIVNNDPTNPTYTENIPSGSTFSLPKITVRVLEDGIEQTSILINSVENIDFKLQY